MKSKNFNTDRVLQWWLILEEYIPDIEYLLGEKDIEADDLSQFPNNVNQQTTHESAYTMENMSELYDIKEIPVGMFSL